MITDLKGKKIKVGVVFAKNQPDTIKYYEGILSNSSALAGETFIILEDSIIINSKYIITIEVL